MSENRTLQSTDTHLVSVRPTVELSRRTSRPPDHAAENKALVALAQTVADAPALILQELTDTALGLCHAHSAGVSLLEDWDNRENFHWPAVSGVWASLCGGGMPRDFGPCGTVLDRDMPLLFSHPERDFPYFSKANPLIEEALLVPFYIDGEARGTVWLAFHDTSRRFDAEDLRVLTSLAKFAGFAYWTILALALHAKVATEPKRRAATAALPSTPHQSTAQISATMVIAALTPREREIMYLVVAGLPNKIIAANLAISQRTVEYHRAAVMRRTRSASLPDLTRLVMQCTDRPGESARPPNKTGETDGALIGL